MAAINRVLGGLALAAAFVLPSLPASAQDAAAPAAPVATQPEAPAPRIAVKDLAGRSALWDAQLSPDGSKLSFLRHAADGAQFIVSELDGRKVLRAFSTDSSNQF